MKKDTDHSVELISETPKELGTLWDELDEAAIGMLTVAERTAIKRKLVMEAQGEHVLNFLDQQFELPKNGVKVCKTCDPFNIEALDADVLTDIINLHQSNDIPDFNKLIATVNHKLAVGGTYTGCVETIDQRLKRILSTYPWGISHFIYGLDFIHKRVFPKLPITRQIYKLFAGKEKRTISKAETLGRMIYGGFEVDEVVEIDNLTYFKCRKVNLPCRDKEPSKGLILKINRVGYLGKTITVYKFRTMHPYAQYLQDYVYKTNSLQSGGKFRNDFRVTSWGRMMRKLWIDEIPMLYNMLRGDLKLVGVRPISSHYLSLYSDELKQKRKISKPGMIPPFYADLPKTLEEIMDSEMRYLKAYEEKPRKTDWRYFRKALKNIIFKRATSN